MNRSSKMFLMVSCLLLVATASSAQTSLFFTEYVEGSSFNKCVEVYNRTGATVDLSLVTLQLYSNGSTTANSTDTLSGTLAAGDVVVVCNPSIADPSVADILSSTVNYNGDDAFELVYDGSTMDVIGQIGVDPGSAWVAGGVSTQDATLRRKDGICQGDPDGSDAFDPSVQWDAFATDTFDGLGTFVGCDPVPTESASFSTIKALYE